MRQDVSLRRENLRHRRHQDRDNVNNDETVLCYAKYVKENEELCRTSVGRGNCDLFSLSLSLCGSLPSDDELIISVRYAAMCVDRNRTALISMLEKKERKKRNLNGTHTLVSRSRKSRSEVNRAARWLMIHLSIPSSSARICECSRRCVTECLSHSVVGALLSLSRTEEKKCSEEQNEREEGETERTKEKTRQREQWRKGRGFFVCAIQRRHWQPRSDIYFFK